MLPGVPGAESGRFSKQDLFIASDHEDASALAGSLIFGIGCHAGNNLPTAYYGPVTDWVDVFSQAGGYIGNTGYGLANNVTTALGERLLGLYSQWLGVSVDGEAGLVRGCARRMRSSPTSAASVSTRATTRRPSWRRCTTASRCIRSPSRPTTQMPLPRRPT